MLTDAGDPRAATLARTVLRHLAPIDARLDARLSKDPPAPARDMLRLATAEICALGTPPHAAVDAAVGLAKANPKTRHLSGLVNAVLRRIAEDAAPLDPTPLPDPFGGLIEDAYGAEARADIEAAHAAGAPIDLTARGDPAALAEAVGGTLLPTGSVRLARAHITKLPGFEAGDFWVQDAAAALPARLMGDVAGARVLDLCAAPGGKTMQLAAAGAEVTALDLPGPRLDRLGQNLNRTRLTARIVAADARRWTPDAPFDAILLDAPCSATGTIRRHPELPRLRAEMDPTPLFALQTDLLDRAMGWLRPGGRLVYAVCSLLPAEGEDRVAGLGRLPLPSLPGVPEAWLAGGALRTRPDFWPEQGGLDGFFAVALG